MATEKDPYIEKPDELAVGDGSSCFLDQQRMCDADCRAYDPGADPGPARCTLLGGVMDIADGLQDFVRQAALTRKTNEDRSRAQSQQAPVPDPFGKKAT